jgi:hypothetical protein
LFNDEQNDLQNQVGQIEDVRVVMMPSKMQACYFWDWEWPYNDNANGEVFQPGYYDDANQYVCIHAWEREHLAGLTPTTAALGDFYTQPWEVWVTSLPGEPPPIPFPDGFHRAKFMAWDRKPVEPSTLREVQSMDRTWKTRQGDPMYYYRDENGSNRHYLYPLPSSITWTDQDNEDADPDEAAYASTSLDVDDNLLVVFDKNITDLSDDDDSSAFATFLHKYIEYGTISRAYGANTDGRIRSLSEYWKMRKQVGIRAIRAYLSNRRVDRDYCLTGQGAKPIRSIKHPRLPNAFPDLDSFNSQ